MTPSHSHTLVIANNHASKLKNISREGFNRAVISPLKDYGINKYDVLTRPTISELDSSIQEDSLLVVCGGDGTVNRIVNYVLGRILPNTILPLPFGGANDIATGLYDNMQLCDILASYSPDKAHTIEARLQKDNDEPKIIRALGYIGIGTSGYSAEAINRYQGKYTTESGSIIRAIKTASICKPFTYLDSENNTKKAIELLAINNRMARYIKSRHDTTFKPELTFIEARDKLQILSRLCLGMLGFADGEIIEDSQSNSIRVLSQTILQSDGEPIDIEPDTEVTFRIGPPVNIARVM